MQSNAKNIEEMIRSAKILIVDDEFYMRKVIRTLLLSAGLTDVHDAPDGTSGLFAISTLDPDVVFRRRTCRSSCSPGTASIRG
jgi:two-component system, chemotaxis family, chemotaxis protein CheY